MSSKDVLERKRIESLVQEGFLPIRAQFLRGPSSPEEENVDGPKKPLEGGKEGGKATVLQSNKNGLRQGTKSQKQRKREKYLSMRNDLCHFVAVGKECKFQSTGSCERAHDAEKYLEARKDGFGGRCFVGGDEDEEDVKCPYEKKMKDVRCPFGVRCYFSDRHENNAKESKTLLEWRRSAGSEEFNAMEDWLQKKLRESTYLLPRSTKYLEMVGNDLLCVSKAKKRKITAINRNNKDDDANENANEEKTVKKNAIDFNKKLVLAPLTTVGHAPFRRMCVKFGADVTISEMAMASNLLAGDRREWALVRRHACESSATNKFGVQICGGYPDLVSRCVVRLFCFVFRVVCLFARVLQLSDITSGVMIKPWDFFGSRSPSRRKGGSAGVCSHSLAILQLVSSQCCLTARSMQSSILHRHPSLSSTNFV